MSAPQTNVETQKKRHRPALGGMKLAVGTALVLLVGWLVWVVAVGNDPQGAEEQIDGRTGEETQTE